MMYKEATQFLFEQFPQYHTMGAGAYKPGLGGMETLAEWLHHPHDKFPSIHIAGTNGKGSVSHMLAAVLQQAGYKTGLYTSPHLVDFRERIKINGQMISQEAVTAFVERYQSQVLVRFSSDTPHPSFFEITTALAFSYFAQERVDVAVIETGLGGRLDSTNIIAPSHKLLSIITNIGLEHCDMLGDTLEKIAGEKAGIIKPGVPVVIGEREEPSFSRICAQCRAEGAPWYVAADYQPDLPPLVEPDLPGVYQVKNRLTVQASVRVLREHGLSLPNGAVVEGMAQAAVLTGLRGRWECLGLHPKMVADTGHNAHGLQYLNAQLAREQYQKLYVVFGVVVEKDIQAILPLLPKQAYYFFTQAHIHRALPAPQLAAACEKAGLRGEVVPTVTQALSRARQMATSADFILIGGSNFTVGEALEALNEEKQEK